MQGEQVHDRLLEVAEAVAHLILIAVEKQTQATQVAG
jgi:hypothetical protein